MLANDDAAALLAGPLLAAIRLESTAWRYLPAVGRARADALLSGLTAITNSVALVVPSKGTYSLTSSDAPLIVTVRNDLDRQVRVRLTLSGVGSSAAGFSADDVGVQEIPPGTARTIQVPAHFERSGRFRVQISLDTPDGGRIGEPLVITVNSSAYGSVALIITFAAFGVLVLALLIRLIRRIKRGPAPKEARRAVDPPAEPTAPGATA